MLLALGANSLVQGISQGFLRSLVGISANLAQNRQILDCRQGIGGEFREFSDNQKKLKGFGALLHLPKNPSGELAGNSGVTRVCGFS